MKQRSIHALARLLAVTALLPLASFHAAGAALDDAVQEVQHAWEMVRYRTPETERERGFEALVAQAHQASQAFPGRSEPLIWEGIVLSSLAGEKGGLGALRLVKQAKALYEQAMQIDADALGGSAYNSLGVLYYKVPGWPFGFGDEAKAQALLQKALAISPQGIDANYFYGEFLVETDHADQAVTYLERALRAPDRPGRQIADAGRRAEARALLAKIKTSRADAGTLGAN